MPKLSVEPTDAGNLEAKFDAGEDVLDYFDLRTVRVEHPVSVAADVRVGRMPSLAVLKRAVRIAEEIQELESKLSSILAKRDSRSGTFLARQRRGKITSHGNAKQIAHKKYQPVETRMKVSVG